jgi:homoserine dehydrogenase
MKNGIAFHIFLLTFAGKIGGKMNKLTIGLFGFGCVGQGLHYALEHSTGFRAAIRRIAVKHPEKARSLDAAYFTFDKADILGDEAINVVVELIDDADEAYNIVSEAMRSGKHVVTANKKMLALHLTELLELQKKHNVSLLYEAAACGSIPIIRSLEEYFDNEELVKVSGIFNGTTNYILTKTIAEGLDYAEALTQAQAKGFAETDPTNDVEGFDALYKTVIIALHGFGAVLNPDQLFCMGITTLQKEDITYAAEKGYKIKLTPTIKRLADNRLTAYVIPRFVRESNHLFKVDNEFNGVVVEGVFSGEQFLQGRGAGSLPTGAAVLSDVSALSYGYQYEYKKHHQDTQLEFTNDVLIRIYFRFEHELDIVQLGFERITEKYVGEKYQYVIGLVRLQSLLRQTAYIKEKKLFVAAFESN